jgi:hypothetical protein
MTDRQEIRAKSAELAIRLLGVAMGVGADGGTKRSLMPNFIKTEEAQAYFDSATNLARQFEAFISDSPGNT